MSAIEEQEEEEEEQEEELAIEHVFCGPHYGRLNARRGNHSGGVHPEGGGRMSEPLPHSTPVAPDDSHRFRTTAG